MTVDITLAPRGRKWQRRSTDTKSGLPLPIRSTRRPSRSPKFPDQARPLLGCACTRLVPDRVHWCMAE